MAGSGAGGAAGDDDWSDVAGTPEVGGTADAVIADSGAVGDDVGGSAVAGADIPVAAEAVAGKGVDVVGATGCAWAGAADCAAPGAICESRAGRAAIGSGIVGGKAGAVGGTACASGESEDCSEGALECADCMVSAGRVGDSVT